MAAATVAWRPTTASPRHTRRIPSGCADTSAYRTPGCLSPTIIAEGPGCVALLCGALAASFEDRFRPWLDVLLSATGSASLEAAAGRRVSRCALRRTSHSFPQAGSLRKRRLPSGAAGASAVTPRRGLELLPDPVTSTVLLSTCELGLLLHEECFDSTEGGPTENELI